MISSRTPKDEEIFFKGSVFYCIDAELNSDKPHFFIIINNDPINDGEIYLVCASSQIEKCKNRRKVFLNTLVEIKSFEYMHFTCDSIVDCNTIFIRTKTLIREKLRTGNMQQKSPMDVAIIKKIQRAAIYSGLIERYIKEKLK